MNFKSKMENYDLDYHISRYFQVKRESLMYLTNTPFLILILTLYINISSFLFSELTDLWINTAKLSFGLPLILDDIIVWTRSTNLFFQSLYQGWATYGLRAACDRYYLPVNRINPLFDANSTPNDPIFTTVHTQRPPFLKTGM